MNDFEICIGEDFVLGGEAEFTQEDPSQNFDDYDIVLMISTSEMGKTIKTYTESDRGDVQITRLPNNRFSAEISHSLTSRLSVGNIVISVALIHKDTGKRSLSERKTGIMVCKNRLKDNDL